MRLVALGVVLGAVVGSAAAWTPTALALPPSAPSQSHAHGEDGVACRWVEWEPAAGREVDIAALIPALEARLGVVLMARDPKDTVDGAVTVIGNRQVIVDLYEVGVASTGGRESTLRAAPAAVRDRLTGAAVGAACAPLTRPAR